MEPCPQQCPSPPQFKCRRGGGGFPPPIDIGNRFQCRCRGGNAQQTMSVDRRGGESSPPWLRHRKPFPMSLGGGKAPPPLRHLNWSGDGHGWGHGSMSPRGCGEETGVRKPFSSPPAGTVSFRSPPQPVDLKRRGDGRSETVFVASCRGCVFSPPPSMDLERRGDGRSETVFAASAGKLPDPTSPHLIWRGGKRSKTFFVVSDRQGIKSSSHGPRNRRGGRHSETVCIVVSKTLGGVQRPSLDFFCIS